jgi:hypothetical protein
MSQAKTAFVLLVVFFAGCAASAASQFIVPPAHAGTNPQRWEYTCRAMVGAEGIGRIATEFGQQGWEMASAGSVDTGSVTTIIWCFKRPLP